MKTLNFEYPEFHPDKKFPKFPKFENDDYKVIEIKNTTECCPFELWNETILIGRFSTLSYVNFMMGACVQVDREIYNHWKHKEIKRREESRHIYYRKQESLS